MDHHQEETTPVIENLLLQPDVQLVQMPLPETDRTDLAEVPVLYQDIIVALERIKVIEVLHQEQVPIEVGLLTDLVLRNEPQRLIVHTEQLHPEPLDIPEQTLEEVLGTRVAQEAHHVIQVIAAAVVEVHREALDIEVQVVHPEALEEA